ncbi:MAG: 30S ribosomal protein S12 methylthiotransferase RimO [Chloroflexi bacterium]|nr:30S ribosomal protein S12 methylthiotransferase RimO [Chloroflexota bacterium]
MRFYLETLGCPKNTVDAEMMGELLRQAGHQETDDIRRANLILVNTCGFIRPAREESYKVLKELAAQKRHGQWLIAAGCLAQRYGDEIRRQVPQVDAIIGTQNWPDIVHLVEELLRSHEPVSLVRPAGALVTSVTRRAKGAATAYLKIADGCDASCAFCAIPLIKGPQRSKPLADILREAEELVAQGVREIVLIAQNTTAYGRDLGLRDGLPLLIEEILAHVPHLRWLRILYAYPQDVSERLIELMARAPQICHYLDLPLQHGHPATLRRMGRPYDLDRVQTLIASLRRAIPDIALRSTFIVGYPGETEEEFEGLLDWMTTLALDKVGVFAYSPEEGTPAVRLPNHVPPDLIAERYERAMLHQQAISLQANQHQVGRELEILIDGAGDGLSVGRSYREAPEIDGYVFLLQELPVGEFVRARIIEAQEYDLVAEPLHTKQKG